MKKFKSIIFLILIILILILGIKFFDATYYFKNQDIKNLNLDNVNKLMIVAHADDELLWGGAHLLSDDYLVVCITCGTSNTRTREFINVMRETNDEYIILDYPNTINGVRSNWQKEYLNINKSLKEIIEYKDWDLIVTHNPNGEYGHIHHKMTNKIVTDIVEDKSKLAYFGIYHSKKNISKYLNKMTPISDNQLKRKRKLIGLYKTQKFIQYRFNHMYAYENFINYEDWKWD